MALITEKQSKIKGILRNYLDIQTYQFAERAEILSNLNLCVKTSFFIVKINKEYIEIQSSNDSGYKMVARATGDVSIFNNETEFKLEEKIDYSLLYEQMSRYKETLEEFTRARQEYEGLII